MCEIKYCAKSSVEVFSLMLYNTSFWCLLNGAGCEVEYILLSQELLRLITWQY